MPRKCQHCSLRTNHLREGRFEHQPNEYIGIDQLVNITKIYAWDIYELAKWAVKKYGLRALLKRLSGFSNF